MSGGLKKRAKGNGKHGASKHRPFAYMFILMSLKTRMYVAFGSSMKSEKDDRAISMIMDDIVIDPVRLDRYCYYTTPTHVGGFGVGAYIVPKRNLTLKGSQKRKDTMEGFIQNTAKYLERYHLGGNSEAGFSADKKMFGWGRRSDDRIDSAPFCTGPRHNPFNLDR